MPLYEQLTRGGGAAFSPTEVRSLIRMLWVAGTTTTRRALASCVLMLLRHPQLRERVVAEPELLDAFVEETLRLHPPEHTLARVTTAEAELGGVRIPAGAAVRLCVAAANRDPARFTEPAALLPERANSRQHLSFGGGVHRCVGAGLAHAEMTAALRVLLRLAPRFRSVVPADSLPFAGFANDTEELLIER
jgi:cytochrome P450